MAVLDVLCVMVSVLIFFSLPIKVRYADKVQSEMDPNDETSLQAHPDMVDMREKIKSAGRKALQRLLSQLCAEGAN